MSDRAKGKLPAGSAQEAEVSPTPRTLLDELKTASQNGLFGLLITREDYKHVPEGLPATEFTYLYYIRLLQLEAQLLDLTNTVVQGLKRTREDKNGGETLLEQDPNLFDVIGKTLHDYAKCVEDFQAFRQMEPTLLGGEGARLFLNVDPQLLKSEFMNTSRITLRDIPSSEVRASDKPTSGVEADDETTRDNPPVVRKYEHDKNLKARVRAQRRNALWKRFIMALIIGVALIGPMLIMVLHPGKATALATTSGAILLFSFFVAGWLSMFDKNWEDNERDVLLASAAYAAVLVVFVGASLTLN